MPVDYLSGVGEAMEERGRRWRCADAGEHGQPGRPPLEVWTLGKECGRRRARAQWPLAAGGSTDAWATGGRGAGPWHLKVGNGVAVDRVVDVDDMKMGRRRRSGALIP